MTTHATGDPRPTEPDVPRTAVDPAERARRRAARLHTARLIGGLLVVSTIAALALTVVYWRGGQPQLEGLFIFVAFGCFGMALVLWARHLLPGGPAVQDRPPIATSVEAQHEVEELLDREGVLERRTMLRRLLATAIGAFGLAALFPLRSLGPSPGDALVRTPWGRGRRLVNQDGKPVRADELPVDGVVTAFPEGAVGSADGQAVVVRVGAGLNRPLPGRESWAPDGLLAYSKVCTHAGCPVGLYQANSHSLLCPCHQSAFDVLDGGRPTEGPAARALPQLPLTVDEEGVIVALGDFSEPVGPAWWGHP